MVQHFLKLWEDIYESLPFGFLYKFLDFRNEIQINKIEALILFYSIPIQSHHQEFRILIADLRLMENSLNNNDTSNSKKVKLMLS